ncbi:DEAD/DEAH box helicase family protein [Brachyspira hyodysenteriae]|uniref:DEAD/DEAH box helicase family protein n=3 Tax=Brachyspira hyodysenteriae TaxID=159 RepID=UPI00069BC12F|nr:DEAD/DEAH box helicase family protein [Brachyspira hyodysenteriae]
MLSNMLQNIIQSEIGRKYIEKIEVPISITKNIKNILRPYQVNSLQYFIAYLNEYDNNKNKHLMFNMATGSGKTLIMASLILYLYEKGYRNFLFFVNSVNIIDKTRENFFNISSNKYLFNNEIIINNKNVEIKEVNNFDYSDEYNINIFVTSIQYLHNLLRENKENAFDITNLQDKKIVILADEAHHFNAETSKNKILQKGLFEEEKSNEKEIIKNDSWESTVQTIFQSNKENFLLEFTATIDYENSFIVDKYLDKTIFKYDLLKFRQDLYSKEIDIIQNDVDKKYLMLGAVILSEYRREVASNNGIDLKPIILFKAHKLIKESQENQEIFNNLIDNLKEKDIDKLYKSNLKENDKKDIIYKAIGYFKNKYRDFDIFISRIKEAFKKEYQLITNEKTKSSEEKNDKDSKEMSKQNKLLNTLENKDNPIRVIFSVNKLNEGWDVLNLFDIVRLYEKRDADTKNKKAGKTTISEAQLIGRGARYYPLKIDYYNDDEIYKRKYDKDLDNDKRILETLYYHSIKDSRYISELRTVLREHGLLDDVYCREANFELKENVKKYADTNFIFSNRREEKARFYKEDKTLLGNKKSFADIRADLNKFEFQYVCKTGSIKIEHAINEENKNLTESEKLKNRVIESLGRPEDIEFYEIKKHIRLYAWYKMNYGFDQLKPKFQDLKNIDELFDHLSDMKFKFFNLNDKYININEEYINFLTTDFYPKLIKIIDENYSEYIGTKDFYPQLIKDVFREKKKKIYNEKLCADMEKIEYYAQNILYADSYLEISFSTKHINDVIEKLKEKGYNNIYLFRNDQDLAIYNFDNGTAFYPDFILICEYKKEQIHYQVFIEPKGEHLESSPEEKAKQDFLLSIKNDSTLNKDTFELDTDKYILFGMRFFTDDDNNNSQKWNDELKNEFKG